MEGMRLEGVRQMDVGSGGGYAQPPVAGTEDV
jgi:hypothetical protein